MSLDVVTSVGTVGYSATRDAVGLLIPFRRAAVLPRAGASAARASGPGDQALGGGIPHEVREAMDAAARAYRVMHEHGRRLTFSKDEETGRMLIQVSDLDGNVLRTIPPSELIEIATEGKL